MSGWQRRQPITCEAGWPGGDVQIKEAWETSWFRPLANGTYAHVTRYFYLAEDKGAGRRWLEQQTEYLICTNPADPGGTDVGSEGAYEELPVGDARSAAEAAKEPTDDEWKRHAPRWCGEFR